MFFFFLIQSKSMDNQISFPVKYMISMIPIIYAKINKHKTHTFVAYTVPLDTSLCNRSVAVYPKWFSVLCFQVQSSFRTRRGNSHGSLKWLKQHVTTFYPTLRMSATLSTSVSCTTQDRACLVKLP